MPETGRPRWLNAGLGLWVLALVVVAAAGVLAVRAYQDWQSLRQPAAVRVQDTSRIRGWMTVRFIARSHRVPVAQLAARLGAPQDGDITLADLARSQHVPVPQVEDACRRAVAELSATGSSAAPLQPGRGP